MSVLTEMEQKVLASAFKPMRSFGESADTACHPLDEQAEITILKQRVTALEETVRRLMAREEGR